MWDPERLTHQQVDSYLESARQAWPHHLYSFVEEAALCYLAIKDYSCELAINSMVQNVDEVLILVRTLFERFHVSKSCLNFEKRLCSIGGTEFQSYSRVQRTENRPKVQ